MKTAPRMCMTEESRRRWEYYIGGADGSSTFRGTMWIGQTFTSVVQHVVNGVRLKLYRVGSPGACYINIRLASGGVPTGGNLTGTDVPGNDFTLNSEGLWVKFDFSPYTLLASTQYALIVRAPAGDIYNYVDARLDSTSPTYSGGTLVDSTDGGVNWNAWSNADLMFEELGVP